MPAKQDLPEYPLLRPIEAFPIEHNGERHVMLRDPFRICEHPLVVNEPTVYILSMFDGAHTIVDIQTEILKRAQEMIPREIIEGLVRQLEEVNMLDSPGFRARFEAMKTEYEAETERRPTHAGLSYEADPAALKSELNELFAAAPAAAPEAPVRGIAAPHIDVRIGGPLFAAAFNYLRDCDAELYVILGTGHAPGMNPVTVFQKDFITPIGTLPVDRDAVAFLEQQLGPGIFEDQFVHRFEHSVEFQTLFLRHILGPDNPARILPILCSSFHELLESKEPPGEHARIGPLIRALVDLSKQKRTCFIAGIDLAHVGLRFGDPEPPSQATLDTIRRRDMELIGILEKMDTDAFMRHFREDKDARRVCGFSPLSVFIHAAGAARGRLAGYDQSVEEDGAVVSFTSMVFY